MNAKFIRVVSDLHLEQFRRDSAWLATLFLVPDERDSSSVLALPGDISSHPQQLVEFIREVEDRFLRVVYVPGNHEYYGHDYDEWAQRTRELFAQHLKNTSYALNDVQCSHICGVRFVFCTLWGDGGFGFADEMNVQDGLYDFRLIRYKDHTFRVSDMRDINTSMKEQIDSALSLECPLPSVVVTHHLPAYELCHPRFGTKYNGGFASACGGIIVNREPKAWIHGHTHDTGDRMLYNTRIVCNPSGYVSESLSNSYNSFGPKFIEL